MPSWDSPNLQQTWVHKSASTVPNSLFMMPRFAAQEIFTLRYIYLYPAVVSGRTGLWNCSCSCDQTVSPHKPCQAVTGSPAPQPHPHWECAGEQWEREGGRKILILLLEGHFLIILDVLECEKEREASSLIYANYSLGRIIERTSTVFNPNNLVSVLTNGSLLTHELILWVSFQSYKIIRTKMLCILYLMNSYYWNIWNIWIGTFLE